MEQRSIDQIGAKAVRRKRDVRRNVIPIIGFFAILYLLPLRGQTSDYLKSVTVAGTGTTTNKSQAWTNVVSITIDLGSAVSDTKYVLVTASVNMRPDGSSSFDREAWYNIYRDGATTDNSGVIKRHMFKNSESGVESWGVGTLVHVFDVSSLSGSVTYTLEHSNQASIGNGSNIYSSANLTAVALSTATGHYELSNDVKRIDDINVETQSATFEAVTGLTSDAITLPIAGDIYVAASINSAASATGSVAEYELQYSSDGGTSWFALGKPIKRSMITNKDEGIVSLVGLLQDQDAGSDYKFRVVHRRVSGTKVIITHNSNLVALALVHSNSGSFPSFYTDVDATGVAITGVSAPASIVTSTAVTAAADISASGSNLFVNSQYLVSASGLNESTPQRMRAGNQLYVNNGTATVTADEYYRYIPTNTDFGAGGFIGLLEDLDSNGDYTVGMKHQVASVSSPDATEDEILTTSMVILTGFQTYDYYDTVEKSFVSGEWVFFAPPVDMLASDVFPNLTLATGGIAQETGDYWLAEYSQGQRASGGSGWNDITSGATQLDRGQGYTVWLDGDQTEIYSSSDLSSAIATSISTTGAANDLGWNLVGNPFSYTFAYADIFSSGNNANNFNIPIYVWGASSSSYKVFNGTVGDDEAKTIAPLQAFFVQMRQDYVSSEFSMTSAALKSTHVGIEREVSVDVLSIRVEAEGKSDKTYLRVHPEVTLRFDNDWDALKFETISETTPLVFSKDDADLNYAINAFTVSSISEEIPLQVNLPSAYDTIKLSFEIEGDTSYQYALYDAYTGDTMIIISGQEMSVVTNGETFITDRLYIQVLREDADGGTTSVDAEEKLLKYADVYGANRGLCVLSYFDNVSLEVFDIYGNRRHKQVLNANEEVSINLSPNLYLVKTSLGDDVVTQKMVVR